MTLLPTDLFRRNVIGLLVTTATLAGLYLTQYREDWSLYRSSIVPEHVADAGAAVDVGGLTWSVESVRYYDDLPDEQIAIALDCRPATVRSLVHRGLDLLRKELT